MPSEALTLDSDIDVEWIKGGTAPTHAASVSDPGQARNIFTLQSGDTDHLDLSAAVGAVDTLTQLAVIVKFNTTNEGTAGFIGLRWSVHALGGEIGAKPETYVTRTSPYQELVPIPITGGAAEAADLSLKILSEGGGWPFGAAVIQIYQLLPTLVYLGVPQPKIETEGHVANNTTRGITCGVTGGSSVNQTTAGRASRQATVGYATNRTTRGRHG